MRKLWGSSSWHRKKGNIVNIKIVPASLRHHSRFRLEAKTRRFRVCDDCSVLLSLEAVFLPLIPAKCGVVWSWVIEDCANESGVSTDRKWLTLFPPSVLTDSADLPASTAFGGARRLERFKDKNFFNKNKKWINENKIKQEIHLNNEFPNCWISTFTRKMATKTTLKKVK